MSQCVAFYVKDPQYFFDSDEPHHACLPDFIAAYK